MTTHVVDSPDEHKNRKKNKNVVNNNFSKADAHNTLICRPGDVYKHLTAGHAAAKNRFA